MDLSWVNVESLLLSTAVVKDTPKCDNWMFSDPNVIVNEFMETDKKIFLQLNAKSYTPDMASTSTSCMSIAATPTPSKSISDVLMNNKKNGFPKFKQNVTLGKARQYNTIVNYMITEKFGVKAAYITDYETLLKYFSEFLWETDPH